MPQNNPAGDAISYGQVSQVGEREFDFMLFEDVEQSDLFWFSDNQNSEQNHAFRKLDEDRAEDTRTGEITSGIVKKRTVYQKT